MANKIRPIIQINPKDSKTIFQQINPDDGPAEPAIIVGIYTDCLSLTQEDNELRLNFETLGDLAAILKEYSK